VNFNPSQFCLSGTKLPTAVKAGACRLVLRQHSAFRPEETMRRVLLIFAVLTGSCAVAQEPSPGVPATASTTSVLAGSDLVPNDVIKPPVYQTKAVLDVRDYGVTCSGKTDDTTSFQSAVTAACNTGGIGKALILPNSCSLRISSTIKASKCSGMVIDGGQSQGQATATASSGNAILLWYGTAGGTVLEINQTRDSTFKNFSVLTNASNYSAAGANVGILVDEIGTVTNIVTNNEFDNIFVQNGSSNSSLVGINICPTAPGNCEAQNFNRFFVLCGSAAPTSSNNGIGLKFAGGEPFYAYIRGIESTNCSKAVDVEAANILDIDGGLAAGNYTDLFLNGGRNISYRHVRSEDGTAQIVLGTLAGEHAHDLTVEENSFAGLTNGTTTISYAFSSATPIIRLIKNDWDANSTVTPFGPTGSGVFNGTFDSQDNNYPSSTLCPPVLQAYVYTSINDGDCFGGVRIGSANGGYYGVRVASPILQATSGRYASLPSCGSGTEGSTGAVTDSTTNTWGATIAGGGSYHVLAYCDGTNWTVAAK